MLLVNGQETYKHNFLVVVFSYTLNKMTQQINKTAECNQKSQRQVANSVIESGTSHNLNLKFC